MLRTMITVKAMTFQLLLDDISVAVGTGGNDDDNNNNEVIGSKVVADVISFFVVDDVDKSDNDEDNKYDIKEDEAEREFNFDALLHQRVDNFSANNEFCCTTSEVFKTQTHSALINSNFNDKKRFRDKNKH